MVDISNIFIYIKSPLSHCSVLFPQALRSELKEREHLVISTLDQARTFLADQPIEGPGEPRKNLQPKTGLFLFIKKINISNRIYKPSVLETGLKR